MAIQLRASSSFSSAPSTRSQRHDVFLSFRGEDTRHGFTGHLYNSLVRKGIKTFIDNDLTRGEEISQALLRAIEESKLSLIVFSENYASSKWCLEELVHILECKRSKNQMVHPIFYKVDPSDVRHQSGTFGKALAPLERRFKDDIGKVSRWRAALSEAATLAGWPFSGGIEFQFIDRIVEDISKNFPPEPTKLGMPKCQVGLDSRVQRMLQMLDVEGGDVRMVGIWGTSGIGKTTIAKAVYNAIAQKFDGCCFLENVRERSEQHRGLADLQRIILSKIVRLKEEINNVDEGITLLPETLRHKRILLVLDDVNKPDQLHALAGASDWFGHGSRIIITTRDKRLLTVHDINLIYEAWGLDRDEGCKLFSSYAFKTRRNILDDNEKLLVGTVVEYARGLPLVLQVLGSHLYKRPLHTWQAMIEDFKRNHREDVKAILKVSYDGLEKTEREVFLDIACFFNGRDTNEVIQILEGCRGINPKYIIDILEEKALINAPDEYGRIRMHNLLEEMGKQIIDQESNMPGPRSRLWYHADVLQVLTEDTGTSTIEGIIVKMPTTDEIRLSPKCFKNMNNLKIFINVNGRFVGKIKHYPNQLRLLDWPECPLEYLPSGFDMKKMVQLNMRGSRITRLGGGFKSMQNLTSLKLSDCDFLTRIPDMSGSPNLQSLDLCWCISLEEVHPSVGYLEKLVKLDLENCRNLVKLPPEVNWRSLQELNLDFCFKLESFPEIVGEMKCMTSLTLCSTGIKTLPSSIRYLINLERLTLFECGNLTDIPRSIYELQKLKGFELDSCPKLVTFPTKVDSPDDGDYLPGCNSSKIDYFLWPTLVDLDLSGWPFVTLPECIMKFVNLSRLTLRGCTRLVEIPELPPLITKLNASDCISLERIAKLSNILVCEELTLRGCTRLVEIPELPPLITQLDASDCVSLERISKLSNVLERKESQMIKKMRLTNCWRLCQNLLAEMAASKEDDDLFSRLLSSPLSEFSIIFPVPRSKIPKWFSCQMDFMGLRRFEFWIEALPNFKWDNTGLALCVALDGRQLDCYFRSWIHINKVCVFSSRHYVGRRESDHVWVSYIPFADLRSRGPLPPFTGRVVIFLYEISGPIKGCGVHLIMPPNEDVCMKLVRAENLTSERDD